MPFSFPLDFEVNWGITVYNVIMIISIIVVQDSDQWNQKLSIRKSATPWKWLSQLMVIGHSHYFNLTYPILLIHEAGSSKTTKIKIGLQCNDRPCLSRTTGGAVSGGGSAKLLENVDIFFGKLSCSTSKSTCFRLEMYIFLDFYLHFHYLARI